MVYQHLEDVCELFLLGVLARDEATELSDHLASGCPNCLAELKEATLTLYFLGQMASPARLKPEMKTRLLRRLRKR